MSKSLKRVRAALDAAGIETEILEMEGSTRTAPEAAEQAGCALDQIVKSIVFQGQNSGEAVLFLTAGGNQVCLDKAAALAGEPLGKADANLVRKQTGFAIGGVSPFGHLNPIRCWMDPKLFDFDNIWTAAGTPRHVFPVGPAQVQEYTSATVADFTHKQ